MGHLAALPSPSLFQACGRAGAGKGALGSRVGLDAGATDIAVPAGAEWRGGLGVAPGSLIFLRPFLFRVAGGGGRRGGSLLTAPRFGVEALPVAPDRPAEGLGELQPARCSRPRGCADGARGRARGAPRARRQCARWWTGDLSASALPWG